MNRSFRFVPLPSEQFVPLFDLSDGELQEMGARRMIVDETPGSPCRVSPVDAEVTKRSELEDAVGRLLADERVRDLHIHNAIPGRYNCRVVRA